MEDKKQSVYDVETAAPQVGTDDAVRRVEGYEILEEIGRGGMGIVYKAHQLSPDRIVALKMIRAGRFATSADVRRFAIEIDAIAKLEHEHIVPIYEIGSHHGEHFFTMQFIEGTRFDEYLSSNDFDRQDALEILVQVCDAVAFCHDRGIIHRDLKPSNVLLDERGSPKLTDFGLAKHLENESNLTRSGELMGTPGYMAPEQASPSAEDIIDAHADVYSLGAILYKILVGKPPIDVEDVPMLGAIERVCTSEIIAPKLIDRWIPRDLDTICMKCLDSQPQKRYANAGELASELRRFRDREPIEARPISRTRRLLRWSRQQPGLAVTWLMVTLFYLYHLWCVYGSTKYYDLTIDRDRRFHGVATAVTIVWLLGAYCFQKLLVRTRGAHWPLFGWGTMEVALLTVLLSTGNAAKSSLSVIYFILAAASVLRFQPILVAYVTSLCLAAYAFQVWLTRNGLPHMPGESGKVTVTQWAPMGLGILSIGVIQYFALRRSRAVIELVSDRNRTSQ